MQAAFGQALLAKSAKHFLACRATLAAMRTRDAQQNYRERVGRVVAFIVAHPMVEHRLEDLAALAHFSPYHFHRVYHSVAGETVAATLRRIRLAQATRLLEQSAQSITEVALSVGYDSPQAFTRAFGHFTGESPSSFRQHMPQAIAQASVCGSTEDPQTPMSVQIVERAAQRLHALRHHGPLSTIPHTQRRLHRYAFAGAVSAWLGASYGEVDDRDGFRYYAAALLPASWPIGEAPIEVLEIPAGRYARHCLVGPYARISAAVTALYTRWLPGSGYEPDDRPFLEHYLNAPHNAAQSELRTDLLIPIRAATTP